MSKVLKRLYLGDVVKSFGTKQLRKLTTEQETPLPERIDGYLTFSSPNSFTLKTYNNTKNWDGELEYSTDTKTWNVWDGTTTLSADSGKLYLRGTGNTIIGTNRDEWSYDWVCSWVINGTDIDCKGNIENLLDYATVINGKHPPMSKDCYRGMFHGNTSLTTAPELPATTLTESCYRNMFAYCTSLTTAPELPATTLVEHCYASMFDGCASLTTIPELPATTLATYCYNCMFYRCTSIILNSAHSEATPYEYRIPTSGAGTTAFRALTDMFTHTGGTFTGTPSINTTYYTSNTVV